MSHTKQLIEPDVNHDNGFCGFSELLYSISSGTKLYDTIPTFICYAYMYSTHIPENKQIHTQTHTGTDIHMHRIP